MLTRRAVLGGGIGLAAAPLLARPTPLLAVPEVERLELTVLADGSAALFGVPVDRPDLTIVPTPRLADYRAAFRAEWGYSVLAQTRIGASSSATLVDFGFTPEALVNNMALAGVNPGGIDAMVLSHGHYDHFGGLAGLETTGKLRRGVPLHVGGEEAFCRRLRGTTMDAPDFGALDRHLAEQAGVRLTVSTEPRLVADHGFVTGAIPLVSAETPKTPTAMKPGEGCQREALDPAKREQDFVVDDSSHELGTAFHVKGRGLVVIGSCSHRGIINTVMRAQAVSGVTKVHAIMGGFHLVPPQTPAQAEATVAMMRALNPDYVFPGHCSGEQFIAPALAAMPGKVFRAPVGTKIILGAKA
jgi:7,8-dihydropterin-6-yl-methyl-4-(beta-D-ribofuranosyl)aminobenzene 5'-phosphate synthase